MIAKQILCPERIRKIGGSFAFIEHRFLQQGFLIRLGHGELLLYLFLVLAADRHGLSYYRYERICRLLKLTLEDYIAARNGLIANGLIAFDGRLFQVLSLPPKPPQAAPEIAPRSQDGPSRFDPRILGRLKHLVGGPS
jgi:hypothetical protein